MQRAKKCVREKDRGQEGNDIIDKWFVCLSIDHVIEDRCFTAIC